MGPFWSHSLGAGPTISGRPELGWSVCGRQWPAVGRAEAEAEAEA